MLASSGWICCENTSPVSQVGCVDTSHSEPPLKRYPSGTRVSGGLQARLPLTPAHCCRQALQPFSPEGIRAVRFQRTHQANVRRSQTDNIAKAA
jgi:hypothetical protein